MVEVGAQPLGQRQHDPAVGDRGEQALIEPQAPLGEPPRVARGAELATLAAERDQELGAAPGAAHAREPVLEQTAIEEPADCTACHRAQRPVRGLEPLLVHALTALGCDTGKVVATIANGDGVDALGWDPAERLIYIPAGRDSSVTIVHEDSADRYTVVATVPTMIGAKTITVDPIRHAAYLFQPRYGPAPPPSPDAPPPAPGARPARGPVIGAWFFAIRH